MLAILWIVKMHKFIRLILWMYLCSVNMGLTARVWSKNIRFSVLIHTIWLLASANGTIFWGCGVNFTFSEISVHSSFSLNFCIRLLTSMWKFDPHKVRIIMLYNRLVYAKFNLVFSFDFLSTIFSSNSLVIKKFSTMILRFLRFFIRSFWIVVHTDGVFVINYR